jgi:hypothetical protein
MVTLVTSPTGVAARSHSHLDAHHGLGTRCQLHRAWIVFESFKFVPNLHRKDPSAGNPSIQSWARRPAPQTTPVTPPLSEFFSFFSVKP